MIDVIKWLESVEKLDRLIDAKLAERSQWWDLATRITANMDGMPHGCGVSDPVGSAGTRLAQLVEETDKLTDMYIDHKRNVLQVLEKLPAKEYAALHKHYIEYMTWEKVAQDMGCSVAQVYRYRDSGVFMILNESVQVWYNV